MGEIRFDRSPETLLEEAEARITAGAVDEDDFGIENLGREPPEILAWLERRIPTGGRVTLVHGDYCLPNVLVEDDQPTGFVDVGRAGVGDPHADLALAARSLAYNWGEWVPYLFECYGAEPDPERLRWYRTLDELF